MNKKYTEFNGLHLPTIEAEILAAWKAEQAFEQSVTLREGKRLLFFTRDLQVPMACQVFIMLFQGP